MLPWATSLAVTIRVGNLLGEERPQRARSSFRIGLWINSVIAAAMIVAIGLLRNVFPYVYVTDDAVAAAASDAAPVFLLLYTFDCLNMVIVGALRGAGQQLVAMKLSLVQAYAISIPVAICLGFYTPLGLFGVWMGLGCGVAVAALGGGWFLSARLSWRVAAQVARKRSAQ
jgi:MATE family multidrug resistance protein